MRTFQREHLRARLPSKNCGWHARDVNAYGLAGLTKEDRQEFNVRVAKNIESGLFDPLAAVGEQLEQL